MNHCTPHWNFDADLPVTNQKKPIEPDNELVELLWRNGQVVLHSQTHRKPNIHDSKQVQKHDQPTLRSTGSILNSSYLVQDDETVSWIQYPFEDSFEKEFGSHFFSEFPPTSDQIGEEKSAKVDAPATSQKQQQQPNNIQHPVPPEFSENPMPPPRIQIHEQNHCLGGFGKAANVNFSQFSVPLKGDDFRSSSGQLGGKGTGNLTQGEAREQSVLTVGSSNQISNDPVVSRASSNGIGNTTGLSAGLSKDNVGKVLSLSEKGKTEVLETTVTSSSGGSGNSFGQTCKQFTGVSSHKRKTMDTEESECQSEAAELDSAVPNKLAKRSGSTRRNRAAEVHNLSERRRRDRINEKMRALQELIPHCNKTDKASMLDEAIEYLKSLQLQLQVMWMGSGMAPMLFPGMQHYMSRIGMGMAPPHLTNSIPNPMHFPRVPFVDQSLSMAPTQNQSVICQTTPMLNAVNYPNQMQNPSFCDQYARFMGFHMQTASQPMNIFRFDPQTVQQSQMMATSPPSTSGGPLGVGAATNDGPPSSKMG